MSEYSTKNLPARTHFPRRNQILAGLSCAIVVLVINCSLNSFKPTNPIILMLVNSDLQDRWILRYVKLAIANMLSNLMVPLSGMVSVSFLGHLQEFDQLAGVVLATVVFNYLYRTFNFLRLSVTGTTAQATGRNDRSEVLLIGLRNVLIALSLGLAVLILQYPLTDCLGNPSTALLCLILGKISARMLRPYTYWDGSAATLSSFFFLGGMRGSWKSG